MSIYLHEIIHTVPGQEEPYMASVFSLREMPGRARSGLDVYSGAAQWRTAGSSGVWPKVVNLWEHEGWQGLVTNLRRQFTDAGRDTEMEEWWNRNLNLRRGGYDRVLLPTSYSPASGSLAREGYKGRVFLHEIVRMPWGQRDAYLERLGRAFLPAAQSYGWRLVGAYQVAMRPTEALAIWGFQDWADMARLLDSRQRDAALREWSAYRDGTVTCCQEMVLLPARHSPLRRPE